MRCSKHPEREAAGVCSYSGKPYCAEELVEVSGKYYAKDNLDRVFGEMQTQASKSNTPMVFMNAGGGSSSSSSAAVGGAGYDLRRRYSRTLAILLNLVGFLGIGGLHRMYTGQVAIGIIQLLTLGGFLIWQLLDLAMLLTGSYRDAYGRTLTS